MIPQQLRYEKYGFCLIPAHSKKPFELEWQKKPYKFNDDRLLKHLANGGNYGVIGGYGRLRILDIDDKELAPKLIPILDTFTVETGSGGLHFYFTSDYSENHVLGNGKGELRASNYQVVGVGCIHPNGNTYKIKIDKPIREITAIELDTLIRPFFVDETKLIKETDQTRSGREWGEILKLIKKSMKDNKGTPDKDWIFNQMNFFSKWKDSTAQYKEITYTKAHEYMLEQLTKKEEEIKQEKKERKLVGVYKIMIDNYQENVLQFYEHQPFFYDKSEIFWFWNSELHKYEIVDETEVMNALDDILGFQGQTISKGLKNNYIEAFKRVGRKKVPKEAPSRWIQFKDKAFSLRSGNIYEVQSNCFFTNPLPWELGTSTDTPIMDKLFVEWVGEDNMQQLYQVIAYNCIRAYPLHCLFCLYGIGRNGKSQFLRLLRRFLGDYNIASTELDLLCGQNRSRFESFKMYKKLTCLMGETNFQIMQKTSMLKQLTGGDLIGYEMKGKDPFSECNYAKIIIATNSLPTTEDTSDGFYRRWIIIDFPNQFAEGKDIINTVPDEEYKNLALKVTKILPTLLETGHFINQGTVEDRKLKYTMSSNPLPLFIEKQCEKDGEYFVGYSELYTAYVGYLKEHKRRIITKKEFSSALTSEGYEINRGSRRVGKDKYENNIYKYDTWILGLKLCVPCVLYADTPTPFMRATFSSGELTTFSTWNTLVQKNHNNNNNNIVENIEDTKELIHLKCYICGSTPCSFYNNIGKPICENCRNNITNNSK